ncbi:MAG: PepSY-associated TM helix domain-containing protein [Opitutaceae bacterium]
MRDPSPLPAPQSAFYRAVWRLHFYAGILVAPFAIFLAVTGSIYLWKPQYEESEYRHVFNVPVREASVSAAAQLDAARAAAPPGFHAQTFQPSFTPGRTAQVVFKPAGAGQFEQGLSLFVDPHTGAVVGSIDDRTRFMRIVHDLHGTLLAGRIGQYIVELAASWALVLFLTGLYLAWPRPGFAVWGFLLPRLRAKGRLFWRDIHAVPAVWLSVATIFMLSTGLLWTQAAGGWYRTVSAMLGQATPKETSAGAHRSELTGWSPPLQAGLAEKIDALVSTPSIHEGHAGHGVSVAPASTGPEENALPLDRVIALAAGHRVPTPCVIALPVGPRGVYSVLSDRNQALTRTYLHLDQYSGRVLADVRFDDFGALAQFSLWGIIAHEGQLFGLLNQILGTLAAGGVVLLALSGLVMWWKRRPAGSLAPPSASGALPRPVILGTAVLAFLLPLLAVSLAFLLVADRAFLFLHRRRTRRAPEAA